MSDRKSPLQALLEEGVREGVFPAAQAAIWHRGRLFFEGAAGAATPGTLFDLASLTKVWTAAAFLALRGGGILEAAVPLGTLLPRAVAPALTLEDLLFHRSGLPAWRPYFALPEAMPAVFAASDRASAFASSRQAVIEAALACAPEAAVATRAVYSDVGFILLGEALAAAAGLPLDRLVAETVAAPLALAAGYRRLGIPMRGDVLPTHAIDPGSEGGQERLARALLIAPTGTMRPRPPAPGQEGAFALASRPSREGEVDDDNAWAMDGVAGHAGLFSTAHEVARFGQSLLEELEGAGKLAPAALWQEAFRRDPLTPGSERALGFDTASPQGSSGGRFMSARAVGHLGFTGTSLWIDPARELVVCLLSNRTLFGRQNLGIRAFRPRFHDCVHGLLPSPSGHG